MLDRPMRLRGSVKCRLESLDCPLGPDSGSRDSNPTAPTEYLITITVTRIDLRHNVPRKSSS